MSLPDFVKAGALLSGTFKRNDLMHCDRDLSTIGITPELREAALARFAIPHAQARARAARMLKGQRHTGYICKIWTSEPERFTLDPPHHSEGQPPKLATA